MLTILSLLLFGWLFFAFLKTAFRVSWCLTKVLASILSVLALPLLVICMIFAGSALLLIPLLLIAAAFGLVSFCD